MLVTGFYPSEETAKKVCKKVKGNCKTAKVQPYEDCFIVNLFESDNYNQIDDKFSKCMQNKIYCGIVNNNEVTKE